MTSLGNCALALYIRDCESLCLSDETLKAFGPFYLVSMPGEVKDPTLFTYQLRYKNKQ